MPHGPLTLLGRQLRQVLANLRNATCIPSAASTPRAYHAAASRRQETTPGPAAEALDSRSFWRHVNDKAGDDVHGNTMKRPNKLARRKPRTRTDYITLVLRDAGSTAAARRPSPGKLNVSYWDPKRRGSRGRALQEQKRRNVMQQDSHSQWNDPPHSSLAGITASYIRHHGPGSLPPSASWESLQDEHASFLQARGYNLVNVHTWATILTTEDSLLAARRLKSQLMRKGAPPVPPFVLLYLLRRPVLDPRVLRILVPVAWIVLESRSLLPYNMPNAIFMLFMRLVRHAREVWPSLLDNIAELLLTHYPRIGSNPTSSQRAELSFILNQAMHLISLPTAIAPYKDHTFQEQALIRILRFMAEQSPALLLNRSGYRAVIRVQLAQPKRAHEQQWAELKALSWPPWKQERTAKDAEISATEHGVSRAADTLRQTREAGFAPLGWERAAEVYAGWDTDRTPTVQTRVLLGTGFRRFKTDAAMWAARIRSTRTVQEAWAAFLAFQDAMEARSEKVYEAILGRLYEEERLQHGRTRTADHSSDDLALPRLLPGDAREIQPLPPSTHLHTYTRTPPPTVDGFYRHLRAQGVQPSRYLLASLIANAGTLRLGLEYARNALSLYPSIQALLTLDPHAEVSQLPSPIFFACIILLCRFSAVPLPPSCNAHPRAHIYATARDEHLNPNHPLARAFELLRLRLPVSDHRTWNALLKALAHPASYGSMSWINALSPAHQRQMCHRDPKDADREAGALVAYRLTLRVLRLMHSAGAHVDAVGFFSWCQMVERVTRSSWRILKRGARASQAEDNGHVIAATDANDQGELGPNPTLVSEAAALLRSGEYITRLRAGFEMLVGQKKDEPDDNDAVAVSQAAATTSFSPFTSSRQPLPRLLSTPSPSLLHAYIRAFGFAGSYADLLVLARWMVAHRALIVEQSARDRNGAIQMRSAIEAMRVFLERSWDSALLEQEGEQNGRVPSQELGSGQGLGRRSRQELLTKLETRAAEILVREVRELVEGVEEWGGWPTEAQVERYVARGGLLQGP